MFSIDPIQTRRQSASYGSECGKVQEIIVNHEKGKILGILTEEKIIAMHKDKRDLAGDLLSGQDVGGKPSEDDLIKLMSI